MSKNLCACKIVLGRVIYCPTHAAAFEMKSALTEIVEAFELPDDESKSRIAALYFNETARTAKAAVAAARGGIYIRNQSLTFLDVCKRALALAEGKDSDHG